MDLFSCFHTFFSLNFFFLFPLWRQKVASRAAKLGLTGRDGLLNGGNGTIPFSYTPMPKIFFFLCIFAPLRYMTTIEKCNLPC